MYMIRSSEVAKCYHRDMSQPVKLSDELVLDARLTAEIAERSIAGQIEFWAQLGRAIEPLLEGSRALALHVLPRAPRIVRSTFPTTSCGRGFPERSTTSKQPSRDCRMC
jgi:hypothetical protein